MRMYLFSDLDDSLFQTFRKCKSTENLTPASFSSDGEALSFMTARQLHFLKMFDTAQVIPVTARNLGTFKRVSIPFNHGAILNYGATVLLPNGEEDLFWQKEVYAKLSIYQPLLMELLERINVLAKSQNLEIRSRIIGTADCNFYVVVKNQNPEKDFLLDFCQQSKEFLNHTVDWCIHHNDNNLAFIPMCLNKSYAVEYMIDTYIKPLGDDFITFGLGDSLVDVDFMNKCHYMLVPEQSQIQKVRL